MQNLWFCLKTIETKTGLFFKSNLPSEMQICSSSLYRRDNKLSWLFID